MNESSTKQKVIDAASFLFYQKGFHGTSVRDIAERANVNVSLISYYFKGKQGLLEFAVTQYYDAYLLLLDETIQKQTDDSELEQCKALIQAVLTFKLDAFQLTAFIHRELSLDSTFVREMAVTYLAKENHLLSTVFYKILHHRYQKQKNMLYMQLKGMIMSPFLFKHEWNNQIIDEEDQINFLKQYIKPIEQWLIFLHNT